MAHFKTWRDIGWPRIVRRGPEVKHAGLAVEKPLAGLIEFLEEVEEVEALALAEAIKAVGRGGLDEASVEVNGGRALAGVGPIPGPVAVDPQVASVLPPAGAVAGVGEPLLQLADLAAVFVFPGAGIRIAGDALPFGVVGPLPFGYPQATLSHPTACPKHLQSLRVAAQARLEPWHSIEKSGEPSDAA